MLFTVCYAYLSLSTAWQNYRAKVQVMNALRCHGIKASISFQKVLQKSTICEREKGRISVLCEFGERPITTQRLAEKKGKQMQVVTPRQCVDLSEDWTSFIGTSSCQLGHLVDSQQTSASCLNSVIVLLEASPPKMDHQGRLHLRDVSEGRAVKLSDLTIPLAWKSGKPFGVLVQASADSFGVVGSAYMEGVLELDDGLLVDQMVCVDTIGEPFNLVIQDPKASCDEDNSFNLVIQDPKASCDEDNSFNLVIQDPKPSCDEDNSYKDPSVLWNAPTQRGGASKEDQEPQKMEGLSHKSPFELSEIGEKQNVGMGGDEFGVGIKNSSERDESRSVKPPNVLVYTGSNDTDASRYEVSVHLLEKVLPLQRYVIYWLKHAQVVTTPWSDNCKLLLVMVGTEDFPDNIMKRFSDYLMSGGSILVLGGEFPQTSSSISTVEYCASTGNEVISFDAQCAESRIMSDLFAGGDNAVLARSCGNAVITETSFKSNSGKLIHSQVVLQVPSPETLVQDTETFHKLKQSNEHRHEVIFDILGRLGLECAVSEIPNLTCCYLLGINKQALGSFMKSIRPALANGKLTSRYLAMQFDSDSSMMSEVTPDFLPVITEDTVTEHQSFNLDVYKKHLNSRVLGNVVLYTEVIPTTMVLFESFMFKVPQDVGVVAIATTMTRGRGRGGNKWLGPRGCAMFSLHVRIPFGSEFADKLPFLQHIASAAVVEAVRSIQGYQDIDLRLKWPNDIYYGDKMKLGGVIVNSSALDKVFHAIIGCGFNVTNSDPTICINDLVTLHNQQTGDNLPLLSVEELIARTISQMEQLITTFQRDGPVSFLKMYYKRWLHSGSKVRLESETGPEVTVEGLDKFGFLLVKDQQGALHSVQPDGNSFDMTKNLVLMKERVK